MEILALSGLLVSLRTNAGYVFLALGRSELLTVMTAVRFAIAVPALVRRTLYFGAKGGGLDDPRNIHRDAPGYAFLHAPGSSHPLAEDASVLWRPAIAAFGMALLVREYLEWTEHDLTTSHAVPALASAVVLGIAVYILLTGLLWALSGFPQSAEARVVSALQDLPRSLRGEAETEIRNRTNSTPEKEALIASSS